MAGNDDLGPKIIGFVVPTLELVAGVVMTATGAAPAGVPMIGKGAAGIVVQGLKVGGVTKDEPAAAPVAQPAALPSTNPNVSAERLHQLYVNVPVDKQITVNDTLVRQQLPKSGERIPQDNPPRQHDNNSRTITDKKSLYAYYEKLPVEEQIRILDYLHAKQLPSGGRRIATDPDPGLKIQKAEPKPPSPSAARRKSPGSAARFGGQSGVSVRKNFPTVELTPEQSAGLDLPDVRGSSEVSSRSDFPEVELPADEPSSLEFPEISGSSEVSNREDFGSVDLSTESDESSGGGEDNSSSDGGDGGGGGGDGGETLEA